MSGNRAFLGLIPQLRPFADWLYDVAAFNGLQPHVTSVRRTFQDQAVLYDRYRRGLSDLPAAPPGYSKHEYGLAFDMVVAPGYHSAAQAALGALWNRIGGKWYSADPVHFEV